MYPLLPSLQSIMHYLLFLLRLHVAMPPFMDGARCSGVTRRASRVAKVRRRRRRVCHLRIGFADATVALPVAFLAVAVAVVSVLAAGAAAAGGLTGAGCACYVVVSLIP
jgi:hypothetical protein